MLKERIKESYIPMYCLYFVALFMDTTSLVVDYDWLEGAFRILRYVTYIYFFARFIVLLPEYKKDLDSKNIKNKSKIEIITMISLVIFGISIVINFFSTHYTNILLLCLVLLSAYKVDYKKIIKYTMILQITLTSITVLLSVLGITQNYEVLRDADKIRYSLGFEYTTNLSQMILFGFLLYMYNKDFRLKYTELAVIQILNVFTYFITDSRTEFIVLELLIVLEILYSLGIIKKLKSFCNRLANIFVHTFFVYPILSFIMVILYPKGGIFNTLNSLLSKRLSQTYSVLKEYGISLFGEKILMIGNGLKQSILYPDAVKNYVDNQYIQLMFKQGIVFALVFIILLNILIYILYKRQKNKELFVCIIYLLFGILNPRIITLLYCPILFMMIPTFIEYFKERRIDKINEQKSEQYIE